MKPNLRLVEDEGHVVRARAESGGQRPPSHQQPEHLRSAFITFVTSGSITLIELRHAWHILTEPFLAISSIVDAWHALTALPDSQLTGWMTWLGVVVATASATLRAGWVWVVGKLKHVRRRIEGND